MLPVCMSANSQTRSARREGKKTGEESERGEERACLNSLWLESQGMDRVKKAKVRKRERQREEGRKRGR